MKIGTSLRTAVATTVLVVSVSACGGGQDDSVMQPSKGAAVVDLATPTATTTDSSAAEVAAKAKADAAAAAAAAKAKAAAEAKAKAAAEAKAKAAAAAKADAAAKAKAAADEDAKAAAAAAAAAAEEEATNVFYENCTAVRAAGADPIRRGEPGYSTDLDRDQDGIACE